MKLVKEYICDKNTPSNEEIQEGIRISRTEKCIVRLRWFFPYSGWYTVDITEDMSFEDCERKLPTCYPV